jgi:hypothetical protein
MTVALLACLILGQGLTPEVIEHAQAGTAAMKQGRFDTAIQEFRQVTAAMPISARHIFRITTLRRPSRNCSELCSSTRK